MNRRGILRLPSGSTVCMVGRWSTWPFAPIISSVTTNGQASALVQFHYGASYEAVGVLWDTAESYPDLGTFLEEFSAGNRSGGEF
jgi:hypothetical protein